MFYKIIDDNKIIGVITEDDFRRLQLKHNIAIRCNIKQSQFVEYNYKYYRDVWLLPVDESLIKYKLVSIIEIEQLEYDELTKSLETNEQIAVEEQESFIEEPQPEETIPINSNEQITIEFLKQSKIKQMSKICHDTITSGVDVMLSDDKIHHFSLEVEDQLKIQALALKAQRGVQTLPWHEDGNYCEFYSAEDILRLYQAMEDTQLFNTTYFNSLKMYIKSLDTAEEISAVTYGMEIPVEYQSEVLQYLLSQQRGEA